VRTKVETFDRFVERAQRTELVHAADRSAAGDGESDARGIPSFARLLRGLELKHQRRSGNERARL
jgi:hypothetical protein